MSGLPNTVGCLLEVEILKSASRPRVRFPIAALIRQEPVPTPIYLVVVVDSVIVLINLMYNNELVGDWGSVK